jgi:uncharacterized Ntn-hydrolase superfamily protein
MVVPSVSAWVGATWVVGAALVGASPSISAPLHGIGPGVGDESGPVHGSGAEPVATFSIVGADPATGEVGIAVQSKFFAVGAVVPWARAGVGAVATQSYANTTYGPLGLDLLAEGLSPTEVIDRLTDPDEGRVSRQVGVVAADGRSATFTGEECMDWAGGVIGANYAAQGNILTGERVVTEMARAFDETEGMLGEKLMAALEAGQAAGGDSRGVQSAAILIVKEGAGYGGFNDRYCDLRVDDHETPIRELRRIFDLWSWNALLLEGYTRAEAGEYDRAFALADRLMVLRPDEGESYYHPACYYAKAGRTATALELLEKAILRSPGLAEQARRDPDFTSIRDTEGYRALVGTEGDATGAGS